MATLKEIVFDAKHPASLARFWASVLDGFVVRAYDSAELARLRALGFTPETDPSVAVDGPAMTLFFQKTDALGSGRNRIHLDVVTQNLQAETNRLLELGATMRNRDDGRHVLLDPEGNAFCLVLQR